MSGLIRALGGAVYHFPLIDIRPPKHPAALLSQLERLAQTDLAIFVSPTAVEQAFRHLPAWPAHLPAAGVGQGSARALRQAGISRIIVPEDGNDSEALLALPQLQSVSGKRVMLFRGEGGRTLIADSLRTRGALVEEIECYRRVMPQADVEGLLRAHAGHAFDAIVLTSREGLAHFLQLLGEQAKVFHEVPFFAPHPRIAEAIRQAGFAYAYVMPSGDEGCVQAMAHHFRDKFKPS